MIMKISHIKVQQSLLIINNKISTSDIIREIQGRCNSSITQISIFNSQLDNKQSNLQIPDQNQVLVIRKCKMPCDFKMVIFGKCLKIVQISYCNIREVPIIYSDVIEKFNVSNNQIQEVKQIRNRSLKLLDLRNNKISTFSLSIFFTGIVILHEFVDNIQLIMQIYSENDRNQLISAQMIIENTIGQIKSSQLVDICQKIIQNDSQFLLTQLLPHLCQQFLEKIFTISKLKRKHTIIQMFLATNQFTLQSNQQALQLLIPSMIDPKYLFTIRLPQIIKILASYSNNKQRVFYFLSYIKTIQKQTPFFIQSQKDLINFMSYSSSFITYYQIQFLISQSAFFQTYNFDNQAIIKYLLKFQNLTFLRILLLNDCFKEKIFMHGLYRQMIRPGKKMIKIIQKQEKIYHQKLRCRTQLYFPQYKQRKSFCLKNDLYDYESLTEYEQMQGSYFRKDFKYTLKFCNKENGISIAKKIETELKKKNFKVISHKRSQHSIDLSLC